MGVMTDDDDDDNDPVLAAHRRFYDAFAGGDVAAMEALWARRAPVSCAHPGTPWLYGRASVMRSWRRVLASGGPDVVPEDPAVFHAEELAYTIGVEIIGEARLAVTNIYIHEDGEWRMTHHHAGPIAAPEPPRAPPRILN